MASRKDSEANSQVTGQLIVVDPSVETQYIASLPWDEPPLGWLNPQQQVQFQNQAQTRRYTLGQKIWSPGLAQQFFVVSGKVRLREAENTKALANLGAGDWFGDLLKISSDVKAVAASKEVVVVQWDAALWQEVTSLDIEQFWHQTRSRYLPQTPDTPQTVSG